MPQDTIHSALSSKYTTQQVHNTASTQNSKYTTQQVHKTASGMQEAGIPHTIQSVEELFNLVDIDGSGIMEWSEFETFVANEIQEGRDFMEGEFVLPSGAGIQFSAMVDVLRRKSRVQAVMKVRASCHSMMLLGANHTAFQFIAAVMKVYARGNGMVLLKGKHTLFQQCSSVLVTWSHAMSVLTTTSHA